MQSRIWINIVMLLVVLGLGGVVYFEPGLNGDVNETQPLTLLDASQVKRLQIDNRHGRIVLQRDTQGWWLEGERRLRAHSFRVDLLLAMLAIPSEQQYPLAGDLAKYGLAKPVVTLQADGVSLQFGDRDPLAQRRYVGVGDVLHLVNLNDYSLLNEPAAYFIDPLLLVDGDDIERIELPDAGVLLHDERGWRFEGEQTPGSADDVVGLANNWRHARAMGVSPLGLDVGVRVVLISRPDMPVLEVRVIETEKELLLQRQDLGLQYHFTLDYKKRLLALPSLADGDRGE